MFRAERSGSEVKQRRTMSCLTSLPLLSDHPLVDGGCWRAVVPTYPAGCRCRLVRVCPSGLTQSPFRTPKGLVSVRVSRDPVEILPQTILLSPRGVSGISHPGRNESFAKQSSVRRMETTAFLQVHGSHPVSNEFGRGTGPGAHVAAIPHAKKA